MPTSSEPASLRDDDRPDRLAVDIRRFPWIRRFAADYVYDFQAVAPFFAGDPSTHASWARAIERTRAFPRRPAAVAQVIAAQQRRRGAPAASVASGKCLDDPQTVAILTGQQAGLFGGPLFTLLKALTALQLAARVTAEHGVPAVAVFWVEAEDHDWDEVRNCTVLDAELNPQSVALPARADGNVPVASVCLDGSIDEALRTIEGLLPATEFRAPLLAQLRDAYAPGRGMADAFARWLEAVLGPKGLVVYDASDPAAKPLVAHLFAQELAAPGRTTQLATAAGDELQGRGYHAQVQLNQNAVALFHLRPRREPVRVGPDGDFLIGDEHRGAVPLRELAAQDPGAFSPNVLLRPVVQDTIFPTICYVAGPNELAYLGQLRGVYDLFGVPMPLFYPRSSATIVDSATLRFLTRHELPLEALQAQDESALNALLSAQIPSSVEAAFAATGRALDSEMERLIAAVPAIDPTLEGAARSTLGRIQHDLSTLHGKMIQAAKRRDETLRRQFRRAQAMTFPHGHAQERTISFLSFLNQDGPALVDRLATALPLDLGQHWIVNV